MQICKTREAACYSAQPQNSANPCVRTFAQLGRRVVNASGRRTHRCWTMPRTKGNGEKDLTKPCVLLLRAAASPSSALRTARSGHRCLVKTSRVSAPRREAERKSWPLASETSSLLLCNRSTLRRVRLRAASAGIATQKSTFTPLVSAPLSASCRARLYGPHFNGQRRKAFAQVV